jgi:DNA-binding response OmpR family regulator
MRLAIVEKDDVVADLLAFAAQRRGHESVCMTTPEKLFGHLPFTPSAVMASFPKLDDVAVTRIGTIRERFPDMVLLVISEEDRRHGGQALAAGANDVVHSPYNPVELIQKAETWLANRAGNQATNSSVTLGDLSVDLEKYAAVKNGVPLVLTKLELRLLYCLCEHSPNLAPIERLLTFGWDTFGDPDASLIKTHISHIRKKMNEAGGVPLQIRSRQTIGYVISTE